MAESKRSSSVAAFAALWAVLFFHRPTTAVQMVGAAVSLGAIWLGATAGRQDMETQGGSEP